MHPYGRRPRILHEELARDPELFAAALQQVYAPNNVLPEHISEATTARATVVWRLLESWHQMPGRGENNTVDSTKLRNWVIRLRELATANGHSMAADIYIGRAFGFSPADADGAWPHRAVRDLIEELASKQIEDSWRNRILNNQGVTMRSLTAGGTQERELENQYKAYATQIEDMWPRTAAVLRDVAEMYRRRANDEDNQADLTQDFWR